MKNFKHWIESSSNNLNLITNKDNVFSAFKSMEGDYILNQKGNYTINGAIEWLKENPEEGFYTIYGSGGYNRYFVYSDGNVKFSAYHAEYPKKETIKKAQESGFQIH